MDILFIAFDLHHISMLGQFIKRNSSFKKHHFDMGNPVTSLFMHAHERHNFDIGNPVTSIFMLLHYWVSTYVLSSDESEPSWLEP